VIGIRGSAVPIHPIGVRLDLNLTIFTAMEQFNKRERFDCLNVELDNGGRSKTNLYDKRDDFSNGQVPLRQ
jgi:hypothetical protein